jgi:hypothetical protein
MNLQRTTGLAGAIVLATTLLSTSALAASPGLTPQAERAMGERYQAMADYYAKASRTTSARPATRLSPQAQKALGERYQAMARYYGTTRRAATGKEVGLSPQAADALGARWEAAAAYYRRAELEQARREAASFDWLDAGIGALVATGAVALLGLGALGLYLLAHRPARPAVP